MGLSSAAATDGAQLCVFDLRRGQQEGQELDKILFFHPADCPILLQLSVIGLCEGIIIFTRCGRLRASRRSRPCLTFHRSPQRSHTLKDEIGRETAMPRRGELGRIVLKYILKLVNLLIMSISAPLGTRKLNYCSGLHPNKEYCVPRGACVPVKDSIYVVGRRVCFVQIVADFRRAILNKRLKRFSGEQLIQKLAGYSKL